MRVASNPKDTIPTSSVLVWRLNPPQVLINKPPAIMPKKPMTSTSVM